MIGLENGCLVIFIKFLLVSCKACGFKIVPTSLSVQVFSNTHLEIWINFNFIFLSNCTINALGQGQYIVKWKNRTRQKNQIGINSYFQMGVENTCMDKAVGIISKSQDLQLTRRNLKIMTRQPFSKPITNIMVTQDMTGVLFNLMATIILKISFVLQKFLGFWNFTKVYHHPF